MRRGILDLIPWAIVALLLTAALTGTAAFNRWCNGPDP